MISFLNASYSSTLSVTPAITSNNGDTSSYKMIFEITNSRARAKSRTAYLSTLKINSQYDSATNNGIKQYRLFVSKRLAPADTARVRDSIAHYFLRKVVVEKD